MFVCFPPRLWVVNVAESRIEISCLNAFWVFCGKLIFWPGSRMSCRAGLPGNSPLLRSLSLLASLHHFFYSSPPPYGFYSPSMCSSFFSFHTKAAFYTSVSISKFTCFGCSLLFLPQSSFYDLPLLPPLPPSHSPLWPQRQLLRFGVWLPFVEPLNRCLPKKCLVIDGGSADPTSLCTAVAH